MDNFSFLCTFVEDHLPDKHFKFCSTLNTQPERVCNTTFTFAFRSPSIKTFQTIFQSRTGVKQYSLTSKTYLHILMSFVQVKEVFCVLSLCL